MLAGDNRSVRSQDRGRRFPPRIVSCWLAESDRAQDAAEPPFGDGIVGDHSGGPCSLNYRPMPSRTRPNEDLWGHHRASRIVVFPVLHPTQDIPQHVVQPYKFGIATAFSNSGRSVLGRPLPAVVQINLRARSKGRSIAGSIAPRRHLRRRVRQDLVVGALPHWYGFELGQRPVLPRLGPPQVPQFAELFGMPAS